MMLSYRRCLQAAVMLVLVAGLIGCSANRRTAPPAEKADVPTPTTEDLMKGWSIHFCSDETVDDNVSVEIGRGDDAASHRVWRAINPRVDPKVLLPEDLRYVDKIWIKLTSENHREVEACVKFDGNSTEKMLFNETEEEEIDRTDRDDCGC